MAKKISKHSRAARRGEIDINAKDLEKVGRVEKTDVVGPVIRAAAKNEELLRQKMEKKNSTKFKTKKSTSMISKSTKHKYKKALILDGKLSTKIEQSINRARDVQFARKSNWESINKAAKESVKSTMKKDKKVPNDDDEWEDIDSDEELLNESNIETRPNVYALLGEDVEA